MTSIGKLSGSLINAANENVAALVNFKVDFSLWKVEAPSEFNPLGMALSERRRREAEIGPLHRTARRLDAMFGEVVPSTPNLVKAYGARVSEIMERPDINPKGNKSHGPFEEHVGADGTAIWSAATSGLNAIGALLLASLLARAWGAKEAVSIWVELIEQHRIRVEGRFQNGEPLSQATLASACQDISRDDLLAWDASARSWLRSADEAKAFQKTQFDLVQKNVNTPFRQCSSTYDSVLSVWTNAMKGVEELLCGRPQDINDGSILTALSAWHLYPNLIVLGQKVVNVDMHDPLLPPSAVATVGSVSRKRHEEPQQGRGSPEDQNLTEWSLTLSHLQHYGKPVEVSSQQSTERVTFRQFELVGLGGLFGHWEIDEPDFEKATTWFCKLWNILQLDTPPCPNSGDDFKWLIPLVRASQAFLRETEPSKLQENTRLLKFGRRRAGLLLCEMSQPPLPFFGLANPSIVESLKYPHIECIIRFFGRIASRLNLDVNDGAFIVECSSTHRGGEVRRITCLTPMVRESKKTGPEGNPGIECVYSSWVVSKGHIYPLYDFDALYVLCDLHDESMVLRSVTPAQRHSVEEAGEYSSSHGSERVYPEHTTESETILKISRSEAISGLFYSSYSISPSRCTPFARESGFFALERVWGTATLGLYAKRGKGFDALNSRVKDYLCKETNFDLDTTLRNLTDLTPSRLSSYMLGSTQTALDRNLEPCPCTKTAMGREWDRYDDQVQWFKKDPLSPLEPLLSFSASCVGGLPKSCSESLYGLFLGATIYENLHEGSTISLRAIGATLRRVSWVPSDFGGDGWDFENRCVVCRDFNLSKPTLEQSLACIIYMETGGLELPLNDFNLAIAMCYENSLYVATAALRDPTSKDLQMNQKVTKLTGNIGRSGLSILVPPPTPLVRPFPREDWSSVLHEPYDYRRIDCFHGTSLHLWFTGWTSPFTEFDHRTIDTDISIVESVISVRDSGEWVADLDVFGASENLVPLPGPTSCSHTQTDRFESFKCTSLDSWDELFEAPEQEKRVTKVGVFRAFGNWSARLAAACVAIQIGRQGNLRMLTSDHKCVKCIEESLTLEPDCPIVLID